MQYRSTNSAVAASPAQCTSLSSPAALIGADETRQSPPKAVLDLLVALAVIEDHAQVMRISLEWDDSAPRATVRVTIEAAKVRSRRVFG